MTLASPIWLIALVPWTGLVALLLIGRRERRAVPFLDLWPKNARPPRTRRQLAPPPLPIWLALLALLLAILSAAGPMLRRSGPRAVTVVLDAGRSMSGLMPFEKPGAIRPARFRHAADQLAAELAKLNEPELRLNMVILPGERIEQIAPTQLSALAIQTPATAIDTGQDLTRHVRRAMAESDNLIVVLSDQPVEIQQERVIALPPSVGGTNVGGNSLGIAAFQLRRSPRSQAMVRLRSTHWGGAGGTPLPPQIRLQLTFGATTIERDLPTPPVGQDRDVFIDLPSSGNSGNDRRPTVATAELVSLVDDLPADDAAYLTTETDWPKIEPAFAIGELSRLVAVYQKDRPAGERSVPVRLVDRAESLGTAAGVIFSATLGEPTTVTQVAGHPASSAVGDWSASRVRAGARREVPAGFTTILSDARGPLVAVREADAIAGGTRQAWVALATDGWSDRAEYVAFFAGLFDWVGRADTGGEWMSAKPVDELTPTWSPIQAATGPGPVGFWPGIYERKEDGRRDAFTISASSLPPPSEQKAPPRSVADILSNSEHRLPLAPWLLVLALLTMLAAAWLWPKQGSPETNAA